MVKLSRLIFVVYILLITIGIIYIINSSVVDAYRDFGNRWSYLAKQSLWILISLSFFFIVSRSSVDKIYSWSKTLYWLNISLLFLVLIPGIGVKISGARRWLDVGISLIQPSEFIKTSLVLYLPFSTYLKNISLRQYMFISLLPVVLILLQPDLGTALIVISVFLGLYIVSGFPTMKLISFIPICLLFLSVYIGISPYRLNRLKTYLNHSVNYQNESYQAQQSLIAIGRGGLFGVGIGQSQQKYNFLPESSTDSIFSIIAEEVGFLGTSILLLLYIILIITAFKISQQISNPMYSITAAGVAILFSAQTLLNLGALTGLLPLTGIPLPLVSYGGSSLLNFSINLGLLSAIAKKC